MISDLIKSQEGNVIFVILTPASDCCATPLFYTHLSQLYTGKQCGEVNAAIRAAARVLHTDGERKADRTELWVTFTLLEGVTQAADSKRVGFDINLL